MLALVWYWFWFWFWFWFFVSISVSDLDFGGTYTDLQKIARLALLWDLLDEAQETLCSLKGPLSKNLHEMQLKIDAYFAETVVDSKGIKNQLFLF
jgi:hypothetical protein